MLETALAAVGERNPETALLEPDADRKAGVQVVINHRDATHGLPPCSMELVPAAQAKRGGPDRPAVLPCESAHYRISVANRRAVCPAPCISAFRQSGIIGREICHLTRYRAAC